MGPAAPQIIRRVCQEVLHAGILVLYMRDLSGFCLRSETVEALELLRDAQIRKVLTLSPAVEASIAMMCRQLRVEELFLEVGSLEQLKELEVNFQEDLSWGISFRLGGHNFAHLPEAVRFCQETGVRHLHIPIQRSGEGVFVPSEQVFRKVVQKLKSLKLGRMQLTLHEPFLWREIFSSQEYAWQGCQAAKSMVYISEELDVTPCPMLSLSFGNLRRQPLREILDSQERAKVLQDLSVIPQECAGCPEAHLCRGGCKARAQIFLGSLNRKDPICCTT
jgi:GeoRSP system SPASM domain protein